MTRQLHNAGDVSGLEQQIGDKGVTEGMKREAILLSIREVGFICGFLQARAIRLSKRIQILINSPKQTDGNAKTD